MGLLGKIWVKLGLDNSEFNKGLNDSQNASNKFKDFIKGVGQGIIAAFSVQAIIQFGKEIFKLASAAQGVEMAFKRIAPQGLLRDLRNATMNSVDDMQLMQRTVQASNFKIPLEQLATYLQFATKRAIETGQSVDYLVDSIITGLGRQSVMILDNLGLSAAEIRTQMEGGASMAEAVSEIINRDMAKGAGVIETAATNSAQLTAAWTNFKTQLGESILGIGRFEKALADTLRYLSSSGGGVTMLDLFRSLVDPSHLKKLSEQSDAYSKMQQEANAYATEQMEAITSIASAEKRLVEIQNLKTAKYDALRLKLREYIAANKEAVVAATEGGKEEQKARQGSIKALEEEITKLREKISLVTDSGARSALNQELANLEHRLAVMKLTTAELKAYNDLIARSKTPLPSVSNNIGGVATTTAGGGSLDALKNHQIYKDNIQRGKEAIEEMKKMQEDIEAISEGIERAIVYGISDAIQTLIDQLVKTGKVDVGSVVTALVSPFGDMLIQLGEVALMSAIGIEAIKESFKSMNPWVAAAAGVALIALGTAVKSGIAAIGASGGKSSMGSQTSFTGGYAPQVAMANQSAPDVMAVIKGEDIWLINQKVDNRKGR